MPPAHEPAAVLDGTLLVRGAGPRAVRLGLEEPVQVLLVEELAAVVGRDAPGRRQGLFADPLGITTSRVTDLVMLSKI